MGCSSTKEKLESKFLSLQIRRTKIRLERSLIISKIKSMSGEVIEPKVIPDYVEKEKVPNVIKNDKTGVTKNHKTNKKTGKKTKDLNLNEQ